MVILFSFAGIIFASFSADTTPPETKFTIPAGWPAPVYDFSKNPLSLSGFKLGRRLFFDPVLSRDSSISCAGCHLQFTGFTHADHSLSHGINGLKGNRNSLTIFNLAWNKSFMWDGGVNNLEVQPISPITNPVEMDNTMANAVASLKRSPVYRAKFAEAFGDSNITGQRLLKALAQYILMLESYNAKYDKYVRNESGDKMTPGELHGLSLFRVHCSGCHTEPLFTNNGFENNGLPVDTELHDTGRMRVTQNRNDSLKFKVPSLRNVAVSYPYMHDGRFHTLEAVIDHYTSGIVKSRTLSRQLQKPIVLSPADKKDLVDFLKTLTDREFLFDMRFRDYVD
jgi:cytochrome c peroxidase